MEVRNLNFKDLQDAVTSNLGRTDKPEKIKLWINLGLQRIATDQASFRSLESHQYTALEEGVRILKLPKFVALIRVAIRNGSASELIRLNRPEYDDRFLDSLDNPERGEPIWYTRFGYNLEFYPVPEKMYTIFVRYIKFPKVLVEDTDESEIAYDNLVISAATVKAFSTLTMPEEASYWHQIYQSELRSIERAERRVDKDSTSKLRGFSTERKSMYHKDPRTVI